MKVKQIIDIAKKRLREDPLDAVHEVSHHSCVYINCIEIVRAEKLRVNMDLLTIAAWWHDLESRDGKVDILRQKMGKLVFPSSEIEKCCLIIKEHSYGGKQTLLESKVLFDADKIEYFNPKRIREAYRAAKTGEITPELLTHYCDDWVNRANGILKSLNFRYSRQRVAFNFQKAKSAIEMCLDLFA